MLRRMDALEAIVDRVMNGQNVDASLVQKYIEQGGDPSGLASNITNKIKERALTGVERSFSVKSITPQTAHKLEVLQDYLDEIDSKLPENYRFDPETGEIRPIGYTPDLEKPEKDPHLGKLFPKLPTDKWYSPKDIPSGKDWNDESEAYEPKGNPRKQKLHQKPKSIRT